MVLILELARGLAALWVFFFHVKPLFEISSPLIYQLAKYGSLGVPMFFVISGYVIIYSAESSLKNNKSPFIFLKNRFLRIYPTFWASLGIVLLTPYIIEGISFFKSGEFITPDNIISRLNYFEWSNFLLLSKVFYAESHDLQLEFNSINSVYWTLAIEFQFYLVVFISLFFGKFYKYVITVISLAGLLVMLIPAGINYGLFIHYWPSFSIGIILAYFHRNGVWYELRLNKKATQLTVLFVVTVSLISSVNYFDKNSFIFSAFFGLLLWVFSDFEKVLNKFKDSNNKLFYWFLEPWLILGSMSYSVYLLHGKIYLLPNMFVRQILDPDNILFGLLTMIVTLSLCYPFYFFIERRFLSKNYKKIHEKLLVK